jgi:hypothetical protein
MSPEEIAEFMAHTSSENPNDDMEGDTSDDDGDLDSRDDPYAPGATDVPARPFPDVRVFGNAYSSDITGDGPTEDSSPASEPDSNVTTSGISSSSSSTINPSVIDLPGEPLAHVPPQVQQTYFSMSIDHIAPRIKTFRQYFGPGEPRVASAVRLDDTQLPVPFSSWARGWPDAVDSDPVFAAANVMSMPTQPTESPTYAGPKSRVKRHKATARMSTGQTARMSTGRPAGTAPGLIGTELPSHIELYSSDDQEDDQPHCMLSARK